MRDACDLKEHISDPNAVRIWSEYPQSHSLVGTYFCIPHSALAIYFSFIDLDLGRYISFPHYFAAPLPISMLWTMKGQVQVIGCCIISANVENSPKLIFVKYIVRQQIQITKDTFCLEKAEKGL